MRLKKLKILYKMFNISWLKEIPSDNDDKIIWGRCNFNDAIIEIANNNPTEEFNTVLHETLHAISYAMNLDLNEMQIDSLANGLQTVLQDNNLEVVKKRK